MKNPISAWIERKVNEKVNNVINNDVQLRSFLERNGYVDQELEHSAEGREDFLMTYQKYVWVYASVYAISTNAAKVPLRIYKLKSNNERGDEIYEGRLWNLINRPNPYQSYFDFMEGLVSSMELSGQGYIEKGGLDPVVAPTQLYTLRPDYVEVIPDAHELVKGYEYKVNGTRIEYTAKEICHIKYYHPRSELYGMTPIMPSQTSMILDFYIMKYQKNFFKQGGSISNYVTVPKPLSDSEYQRFKEQLRANYGGVDNAHILGVFDNAAELKTVATDPQKFLLKEQRLLNRDEVLSAFGVPPIMVGLLDSATFNNTREQKVAFWENTMTPKLQKIQDKFNKEFMWPYGYECQFDLDSVPALQEDKLVKAQTSAQVVNAGVLTVNEARADFYNKEPLEGGDTLRQVGAPMNALPAPTTEVASEAPSTPATGDAGIDSNVTALNGAQISSAIQVIQEVIAGKIPRVAGTELIVAVGIPRDRAEAMINESVKLPAPVPETPLTKRSKTADFDKASAKHMSKYYQVMKNVFGQMEKTILNKVKSKYKGADLKKNSLVNDAFNSLDAETIGMMDDLVSLHEDVAYEEYSKEYTKNKKTAVPAKIKKSAQEAIKKQATQWAKQSKDSIVKTMKDRVTRFMDEAIESDLSIQDVTEGVETIFEGTTRGEFPQARMIARTETSRAINSGKFQSMLDSGMPYKQWIAGGGDNGRPDHMELEELGPVPMDYVYKTDNGEILYPGDPNADVSDLVNCRCTIIPSLVGGDDED